MSDIAAMQKGPRNRPPSLLACIACRKQHLKCDGRKPKCARCTDKVLDCVWVESRRGYRDYRRTSGCVLEQSRADQANQRMVTPPISQPEFYLSDSYTLDTGVAAGQSYTYDEIFAPILDDSSNFGPSDLPSPANSASTKSIARASRDSSARPGIHDPLDIYYKHFHPAHPFLVPWKYVEDRPQLLPEPLKAVIRFIAAHYVPHIQNPVPDAGVSVIFTDRMPENGFKVQALLLYSIVCFARTEQNQGATALDQAIRIALRLGMNRAIYATTHASSNATLQETWRRTWWTLFLVDGMVTAIGGQTETFRLQNVICDVPLPGEDNDYAMLRSSLDPPSLAMFRNRIIFEDSTAYSSLAYTIESMFIMGSIFTMGQDTFAITDPQVEAIDASISNFFLSLPPSKREVTEIDGYVDEPLLLAHMFINWACILLHRPRSTLTFIRNHYATICTKKEATSMPALAYASHTAKTLRAANAIISLASLQRPLSFCTPCLMCGITTAAVVHLPAYAIAEDHAQAVAIKERLQLGISALGRFSEIWSRAAIAKSQIAAFAREVLTNPSVGVDSSGIQMMPRFASGEQVQDLQIPGAQALLEFDMALPEEDQWMQSIIDQEAKEAKSINAGRAVSR